MTMPMPMATPMMAQQTPLGVTVSGGVRMENSQGSYSGAVAKAAAVMGGSGSEEAVAEGSNETRDGVATTGGSDTEYNTMDERR